ncbi:MAG TPA: GAF domain-containing protein [Candidatus Synoicihabitans sp.]|nr:GAF domain-containing protein [Candidatus Synoicihabitans sp.]
MPATYLLATDDPSLLTAWQTQVPRGRTILTLADATGSRALPPGMPLVVVVDAMVTDRVGALLEKSLSIVVGEPHTAPFEQLRLAGRARQTMSYKESLDRLRDYLPLAEELAERTAALDLLMERSRRTEPSRPPFRSTNWADAPEVWDFLEGAIENLASRERLLSEFRRAARFLLRASHTVFFLRDESGFRADRGASYCPVDDPGMTYLAAHPLVLDGVDWPGPANPIAELAVRNRLALWGARLLVPLHDNGVLIGMIACGVRDDGQPYDEADKARAVFVARLLRQCLSQAQQLGRLTDFHDRARLGERYLPRTLILGPDEDPPRPVPVAVRALIGDARRSRASRRIAPTMEQPFRASAGPIAETGGVWAIWEEVSEEMVDRRQQQRTARLEWMRDLALTLNHEIGNALVSLSTLRHGAAESLLPPPIRETVQGDLRRLETVNELLALLSIFSELEPASTDLRTIIQAIGERTGVKAEVGPDPVTIAIVPKLVETGLEAIVRTITENRLDLGSKELSLQLRATGEGDELTALVSIKGRQLELEGILPEPVPAAIPNQGRIGVFLAKEVVRLHGGEIHAGPGLEGTEILISLRKW